MANQIKTWIAKRDKLQVEVDALKREIESKVEMIAFLNESISEMQEESVGIPAIGTVKHIPSLKTNSKDEEEYKRSWSLTSKVEHAFKRENRFLHSREITEMIFAADGSLGNIKKLGAQVSSVLTRLRRDGRITKKVLNNMNRNTFWGSEKWLDENRNVLPEYMYNKKYVVEESAEKTFEI